MGFRFRKRTGLLRGLQHQASGVTEMARMGDVSRINRGESRIIGVAE